MTTPRNDDPGAMAGALGRLGEMRPKAWLKRHRRGYELALVTALIGGGIATLLGTAMALAGPLLPLAAGEDLFPIGMWAASLGLLAVTVALLLTYPRELDMLRTIRAKTRGSERYERARHWTQLKTSCILLNLLTIIAGLVLSAALMSYLGVWEVSENATAVVSGARVAAILSLALALSLAYAHHISLRTPIERGTAGPEGAIFFLVVTGAAVFTLLTAVLTVQPLRMPLVGQLETYHAPFMLLAGLTAASIALFQARSLPTFRALFTERRDFYDGRSYVTHKKSVIMPTMIAFALLFLLLLIILVFELSLVGLVEEIPRNAVLLGVFGFIVVALFASVWTSYALSKSDDKAPLFKRKLDAQAKTDLTILGASAVAATLFLGLAALLFTGKGIPGSSISEWRWIDMVAFATMAALGPYGFYYAHKLKRTRQLEERFPDLLRDLAASRKAGLTLDNAVRIAARGEYGALSPEIRKMADQLSWNVPFDEALQRFADRVRTPLIERATTLIIEASRNGGHVTDVLMAAATDAREIKTLENERRISMGLYSIIIYIAFFVFLGVAAVLYGSFIPEVLRTSTVAAGTGSSASLAGVSFASLEITQFRTFYFVAGLVQAVGNGMLAGLMENGKAWSGLRHAFIMVAVTYLVFALALS